MALSSRTVGRGLWATGLRASTTTPPPTGVVSATITNPAPDAEFANGAAIPLDGLGTDATGAPLTGASLVWEQFVASEPPVVTIATPAQITGYSDGTNITLEGSALDAEDGVLTGAALVWELWEDA